MENFNYIARHNDTFDINDNYLEKILKTSGVKNVEKFLNPTKKDIFNPFLFKNMREAITLYKNTIEKKGKIYVEVDSDTDGYTLHCLPYYCLVLLF